MKNAAKAQSLKWTRLYAGEYEATDANGGLWTISVQPQGFWNIAFWSSKENQYGGNEEVGGFHTACTYRDAKAFVESDLNS